MAKVYRLEGGNGYAERIIVGGANPSIRCTWLFKTSISPITREAAAKQISETRAAGLAVEVIGETADPVGVPPISTEAPWIERPSFVGEETFATPSGAWKIEYVRCEYKTGDDGWTTYRYTWAVTFASGDGRRVEFTALDGRTRGEIIGSALWHEQNGTATVTLAAAAA